MEMITVTFDEKGDPIVDVQGATGTACQDITKAVEDALGMVNKKTNLKPEAGFVGNTASKTLTQQG
tara:strand:+ start:1058 stop:1255 length:198 start_codon:yes stop_codon:yes gene_type:complete